MAASNYSHHKQGFFIIILLLITSISCTSIETRIDRTSDGPNLPANTAVYMRSDSADKPDKTTPKTALSGPLRITTTEAILLSLENNRSLVVERLNPSIEKTFEDTERAVFDPETKAEISAGRVDGERLARSGPETESFTNDTVDGIISLKQFFPTGTTVSLEGSTQMDDSTLYRDTFYGTRMGLNG